MSILIWTKAGDAGYPLFSNGRQLLLPNPLHPTTTLTKFTTDVVLYQKAGVRSRNTWVARLKTHASGASDAAKTVDLPKVQQSNDGSGQSQPKPLRKAASKFVSVFTSGRTSNEDTKTLKRKQPDETRDPGM